MTAIFITATGTDVGKTFVCVSLIRHLREMGRIVDAIKPVVSGFDPDRPEASDPGILLRALDLPLTPQEIERTSPWRFRAAMSPDLAAQREGRRVDVDAVISFCQDAIARRQDILLIEGIGGIMVPLDDSHTVLDWITALRIPTLLVAGSYLGTISHTLTAVAALRQRGLVPEAIVVSETDGSPVPLEDTAASIARFADAASVIPLPLLAPGTDDPAYGRIADLL